MTSRPSIPVFTQAFFDAKLPVATVVAPTEAVEAERQERVSIKTFNGGTMANFLKAQKQSDFTTHQKQFAAVIDRVSTFAESSATQITPALSKASVNKMQAELNDFKTHVLNTDIDYFCANRGTIYSGGKTALHEIDERLHMESMPIQTRMNILQTMTPGLLMCSGAVMTSLEEALQGLRLDGSGLKGMAYKTKAQMVEGIILDHVRKGHEYSSGNEVHFVNHYLNSVAARVGLPQRDDPYVTFAKPYIHYLHVRQCMQRINAELTPEALVLSMAVDYLGKAKNAIQEKQGTSDLTGPVSGDQLTELFKICNAAKLATLDKEFGDIPLGEFVHPVEGSHGMQYQLATNPLAIAPYFLQTLKGQELIGFEKIINLYTKDSPNGIPKILGSLLWMDKDGACEEAKFSDIFALSPKEMHRTMTEDEGLSAESSFKILGNLVGHAAEMVKHDSTANVPEAWVGEIVELYDRDGNKKNAAGRAWERVCHKKSTDSSPVIDPNWSIPLAKIAANQGHAAPLDILCSNMVSKSQLSVNGHSLAKLAAKNGHVNTLEVLAKHRTKLHTPDVNGVTPLMAATAGGHVDAVTFLCQSNPNINYKDTLGVTAVMTAASMGYVDVLEVLMKAGGDVRVKDCNGNSVLAWAAFRGHSKAVDMLVANGAPVNDEDNNGNSVLMNAIESGRNDVVQTLIAKGASVDKCDSSGTNLLMMAAFTGDESTLGTLIQANAKLDVTNNDGKTALMHAIESNHIPTVRALIAAGANIDIKNNDNQNAAAIAYGLKHTEIFNMLTVGQHPTAGKGIRQNRWR